MRKIQIWSYLCTLMLGALVGPAWGRPVRAHDGVSFQVRRDLGTSWGGFPLFVTVGDFNSDGRPDLVETNDWGGVSILLGNGDGTFQAALDFAVGTFLNSITVGDFNADGHLDLATATAENFGELGSVSILLGNGDGSFQAARDFPVGTAPISITVGDFNADGHLDLAAANFYSNTVSILLGTGTGSFQTALDFPVGLQPNAVTVGDFNTDRRLDLAVAENGGCCGNGTSILLNTSRRRIGGKQNKQ